MDEATMYFGKPEQFAIEIIGDPGISSTEARSAEARSLRDVRVWCAGSNLCAGTDEDGRFDTLQVPLIDLASWLVTHWTQRLFATHVPRPLVSAFSMTTPLSERWELSRTLSLRDAARDEIYEWAAARAFEFAATDYILPNVLFQRVDDLMEISWSPIGADAQFTEQRFEHGRGAVVTEVAEWADACRSFIAHVLSLCEPGLDDPRVDEVREFLERSGEADGAAALRLWAPRSRRRSSWCPGRCWPRSGGAEREGTSPHSSVRQMASSHRSRCAPPWTGCHSWNLGSIVTRRSTYRPGCPPR